MNRVFGKVTRLKVNFAPETFEKLYIIQRIAGANFIYNIRQETCAEIKKVVILIIKAKNKIITQYSILCSNGAVWKYVSKYKLLIKSHVNKKNACRFTSPVPYNDLFIYLGT